MIKQNIIILAFTAVLGFCQSAEDPKVQVQQGWLEGEQRQLVTGDGTYYSFKGIPYVAPPVGKLRFKAPQPPLPWSGIRQAKQHGSLCPQRDLISFQFIPGNEDCLFLNVYTPDLKPKEPLPVILFIHGGGFKYGLGDDSQYGPDFLVRKGVVLVTFNYRLEVLGFLSLENAEVPGNAGMKDQVAAMKWVQANIAKFGGDANNVTIMGESAGGASTAFHLLSPMSKGLFKRAITMSGVPLCDWAIATESRRRAFVLGNKLGSETNDVGELLEFLQSASSDELADVSANILAAEEARNIIVKMNAFAPVVEKDFGQERFLVETPEETLKRGNVTDVDVLIGYTAQEAALGINLYELLLLRTYNKYPELLLPTKILTQVPEKNIFPLIDRVKKHYFDDKPIDKKAMKAFVNYISDTSTIYDTYRFVNLLKKAIKSDIYMYKFSCESERNIYGSGGLRYDIHGASHLDDMTYLFDPKYANLTIDKNSKSFGMIELATTTFTNFVKYGTPTPDSSLGVTWPTYDNEQQNYVDITDRLTPGQALNADVVEFWRSVFEEAGVPF